MPTYEFVSQRVHLSLESFRAGVEGAVHVALHAHAPYSQFYVGACLVVAGDAGRLESPTLISGCNVENASYGLTMCAERAAVARAISEGYPKSAFYAIFIYSSSCRGNITSCGACRQVLMEMNPEMWVVSIPPEKAFDRLWERDDFQVWRIQELLPHSFNLP